MASYRLPNAIQGDLEIAPSRMSGSLQQPDDEDSLPPVKAWESEVAKNTRLNGLWKLAFLLLIVGTVLHVVAAYMGGGLAVTSKTVAHSSKSLKQAEGEYQTSTTSQSLPTSSLATTLATSPAVSSKGTALPSRPTSASSSTFRAAAVTISSPPVTDCPASNDTTYDSSFFTMQSSAPSAGLTFTKYCDLNIPTPHSLAAFTVATFNDCINACASVNYFGNSRSCNSAVFATDTTSGSRNCWIKTSVDTLLPMVVDGLTDTALLN